VRQYARRWLNTHALSLKPTKFQQSVFEETPRFSASTLPAQCMAQMHAQFDVDIIVAFTVFNTR